MLIESFITDSVLDGKGWEEIMEDFLEKVAFKLKLEG